ncbi:MULTISPECIES: hypothetical protein [unclassified Streptomyces]|uniref:hypothetical protein n=1 Tax=unclassified Streptomyces TaxID=2593676 RepID=UPI000DC77DB0|nr:MULTISPECIES: hypothetical protein [unclassified Streptomyces]AWZ04237.1 hypothetical protein DRB89_05885 [Streptomyces sp. ICC4]AWZ11847.1 hypothetical protein DRB96_05420 [Streptomyces sp. ICC1]
MGQMEQGFDEFLVAEPKHWLMGRTGDHINSVFNENRSAELPADVPLLPRLESSSAPDVLAFGPFPEATWFLPSYVLPARDPKFAFDVVQPGDVAADGGPFNRATLTLTLKEVLSDSVLSSVESGQLHPVPDLQPVVKLAVPITESDGSVSVHTVIGSTATVSGTSFTATFELSGSLVEAAYVHLTRRGELRLEFEPTYSGYQTTLVTSPDTGFPVHGPIFQGFQFEVFGDGGDTGGAPFEPSLIDRIGAYVFFPCTARFHRSLSLGLNFNTDDHRSRFTITAEGMTRPIIDGNDLNAFAGPRSEYRELTTLGDIVTKYPSLQRIFFGQVSGTVIAVPDAYGILVTAQGALAALDSIVDESPASLSGCRFHFTFTVGPMADPIDIARLRADVTGIPEAVGRTLHVALPSGLDSRTPSTLQGFPAGQVAFADGDGTTIQVGVDISDDRPTPAATLVNLFLQQLASPGPAPLFGTIAVRLDDVFPQPVRTQLLLNLRRTAHSGDLVTTRQPGSQPSAQAENRGPLDLKLLQCADVRDGQGPAPIVPLGGRVLEAGQTTTLQGVGSGTVVEVSRTLEVAAPLPKADMLTFLAFHTHTVQEVQHPLTVNAAGLNFEAEGVSTIKAEITLIANPGDPVPALTLSPSHTVDFVHVSLPVDSAITGLDSTVVLTVNTSSGARTVSVPHDFVDEPILVVTSSTIH